MSDHRFSFKKETLEKTFKARRFMVLQYSSLLFIGCKRQKKLSTRIFGDRGAVPLFVRHGPQNGLLSVLGSCGRWRSHAVPLGYFRSRARAVQLQAVRWAPPSHPHEPLRTFPPLYPRTKMARSHAVCMDRVTLPLHPVGLVFQVVIYSEV